MDDIYMVIFISLKAFSIMSLHPEYLTGGHVPIRNNQ